YGEGGDDHLIGGVHADIMIGGWGNDHYSVENPGDVVMELVGQGYDQVHTSINFQLAEDVEVELLECGYGGASWGSIALAGNSYGQEISGNLGNNVIDGAGGN